MAEFQEVILQFHRMCKSGNCIEIKTCPLMKKPSTESCIRYAFENPCDFENIVMVWATEHPEPVYPTWGEWLESIEVIKYNNRADSIDYLIRSTHKTNTQIPADIAQKLRIEPKEG